MPITFTPHQQAAIDCDAPLILVSAAAGSGKTAVLTARIMRHLAVGRGLEQLLVVTFTEAAAAGMKDKVTERLYAAGGARAARGLAALHGADISTIHAFCRKVVKAHFQQVALDPSFRVGDDAELGLMKAQVMDSVFEAEYEAAGEADANGFIDLVDVFGGKSGDERLDALVRKVYEFLESDPFPLEAAQRYADGFGTAGLDDGPYAAIAREELRRALKNARQAVARARLLCELPGGPEKYIPRLDADIDEIERIQQALDAPLDALYLTVRALDWGKLARVTKGDDVDEALKKRVQGIRKTYVKDALKSVIGGIFFAPPEKMQADITALAPRVAALMGLTSRFALAYSAEKRARNLLDFSDLEHFAIRVLYPHGPADMTPGPVAAALARRYYEVLIDEYQDANAVQELILSAVSPRRFMVGDVKQSIYRFRRANPALFRQKYETYARWEADAPVGEKMRIDLSQNFRSRAEVIDGANFFFARVMNKEVGEIDYDDAAALKVGADYPPWPAEIDGRVQVSLLDGAAHEPNDEEETTTPLEEEARLVAHHIQTLLDTAHPVWDAGLNAYRPCRRADMVILTRSISNLAPTVIETLKDAGIPAVADAHAGFFEQLEIKTALAFLRVVDNPRQDIDLIAVLHSPVYGVDADELLGIRLALKDDKAADFYDCVLASADHPKIAPFLAHLQRWRAAATHMPISRLLGLIYDTTQYVAHAAHLPGGEARVANLRLLLARAMAFEETRLTGLFHFTRYIQRLHDSQAAERVGASPEATSADAVRLMTIHHSKGLEFPIVFVSFLGRKFNLTDETAPVILHSSHGAGPFYTDTRLRTRSNTLPRYTLARLTHHENISEELRCLYVAMTRAMQLLFLTGYTNDYARACEKWEDAPPNAARYLDWIMPALLREENRGESAPVRLTVHESVPRTTGVRLMEEAPAPTPVLPTLAAAVPVPSKLSISELKRLYNSDTTPDATPAEPPELPPFYEPPRFIQAQQGLTAMRMGSILHTLTEHMDYHQHATLNALETLIADLTEKNLLTPEEAAAISRPKLLTLATSPLADRIRAAGTLYREVPFVMQLPTGTLVHGIIDAYFEEGGEIVLIDFKSDHTLETTTDDLLARHATQLNIYKKAIAQATAKVVKEVLLYSFTLGKTIVFPPQI